MIYEHSLSPMASLDVAADEAKRSSYIELVAKRLKRILGAAYRGVELTDTGRELLIHTSEDLDADLVDYVFFRLDAFDECFEESMRVFAPLSNAKHRCRRYSGAGYRRGWRRR